MKAITENCDCCLSKNNNLITNFNNSICPIPEINFLIYRAELSGTTTVSVGDLTQTLQEWVNVEPLIQYGNDYIQIVSDCNLLLSSFDDKHCPIKYAHVTEKTHLKPEINSIIALSVLFFIGIIAAVVMIIFLRHKAKKVMKSSV